ncbi:hypothetical protein VCHA37P203_120030 [Vibrio chagasii]|nr:hypothetical protein VCHA40P240_10149 [Vibrio chagasii]CAH7129514.1 hypothetical protein VCHA40P242_20149 [Vibrio chagasii]CAH7134338.1 hypothetical protein VCHA37P203_120030 [Vibrio chagasii]
MTSCQVDSFPHQIDSYFEESVCLFLILISLQKNKDIFSMA